jgi:hypothetical protein
MLDEIVSTGPAKALSLKWICILENHRLLGEIATPANSFWESCLDGLEHGCHEL